MFCPCYLCFFFQVFFMSMFLWLPSPSSLRNQNKMGRKWVNRLSSYISVSRDIEKSSTPHAVTQASTVKPHSPTKVSSPKPGALNVSIGISSDRTTFIICLSSEIIDFSGVLAWPHSPQWPDGTSAVSGADRFTMQEMEVNRGADGKKEGRLASHGSHCCQTENIETLFLKSYL